MTPIEWLRVNYGVSQADLDAAVAQAVEEEREACAKIADGYDLPCPPRDTEAETAHRIAERIRARR